MKESTRRSACAGCAAAALLCALLFGCATRDARSRGELAAEFEKGVRERTLAALAPGEKADLSRCVAIALENNLDVKTRDMEARLARLDRQASFASFLPTVELRFSYSDANRQQAVWTGSGYAAMSDRSLTMTTATAQQAVFVPQAWFMYSMMREGEEMGALVAERARQLVALQVAVRYHHCLSLSEAQGHLEESVSAAERLARETEALAREGMVTESAKRKTDVLVAARRSELDANRRAQMEAKAVLLDTMGLHPLAEIALAGAGEKEYDDRDLAEQVSTALLNRLELAVADKAVEISTERVRSAVASFVPSLVLVGGYVDSSDSYLKYSRLWTSGMAGVMTVFDGFRNVSEYRASRATREKAFVQREQASLAIMLEVVKARQLAEQAEDAVALAQKALSAAECEAGEAEALWREGMLTESARLEAIMTRDAAWAQAKVAEYRRQVARTTLTAAIGRPRRQEGQ